MAFRQMSGLFAVPVWFEAGIPQSFQWSLVAPYISQCPSNTSRIVFQNFPGLFVTNQANINRISPNDTALNETIGNRVLDPSTTNIPDDANCLSTNVTGAGCYPGISRNRSEPLAFPGKQLHLSWENPGDVIGPNNSYVKSVGALADAPRFLALISQLNTTYVPITLDAGTNTSGSAFFPNGTTYGLHNEDPAVNGSVVIAVTSLDLPVTPFNLSAINEYTIAVGLLQAG